MNNENRDIEREIQQEIAKLAKTSIDDIKIDTPISTLGIDSLAGIALLDNLQERYGVEISAESFFQGVTIHDIFLKISENTNIAPPSANTNGANLNKIIKEIPFSAGQKGIWITDLVSDKPINNEVSLQEFKGDLNLDIFKKALSEAINNHELLRSHVIMKSGKPVFAVQAFKEVQLEIFDLQKNQENWENKRDEFIERKFNLFTGPLIRVGVFQISPLFNRVVFCFHHLAEDGWSATVLFDEIAKVYTSLKSGKEIKLKPETSYGEFVNDQEAFIQNSQAEAMAFWNSHLKHPEIPLAIGDRPRSQEAERIGDCHNFKFSTDESEEITHYCQVNKITPTTFFLSLLFVQLYKKTNQTTISIGIPFLNRQKNSLLKTFGFFINLLPIVQELHDELPLEQVVKNTHAFIGETKKYEPFPYPTIVQELHLDRNPTFNPIFQVMYRYEPDLKMRNFEMGDLKISGVSFESKFIKFDLEIKVILSEGQYEISYRFNKAIFDKPTIENYAREIEVLALKFIRGKITKTSEYPSLALKQPAAEVIEKSNLSPAIPAIMDGINKLSFSLFYFSSSDMGRSEDKYKLLIDSVKLADELDFEAVWVPERHFHPFGGLFPNPLILLSYLASITKNVRLRTGSIILPLHHIVQISEGLSLVDNLSNGRIDASFTCGWNPNDFILQPEVFDKRRECTYQNIDSLKKLWNGDKVPFKNGKGESFDVEMFPKPLQKELHLWLTCADNIKSFAEAGEKGLNILTALLFQNTAELSEKIQVYRDALRRHHPDINGKVTVMLHTFVGKDLAKVKEIVKAPLLEYLNSSYKLWAPQAKSLSEFPENEQKKLLEFAFERYFNQSSLIGDVDKCLKMCDALKEIGVDEVACLLDFGVPDEHVPPSIKLIDELNKIVNSPNHTPPSRHSYQPYVLERLEHYTNNSSDKKVLEAKEGSYSFKELDRYSTALSSLLIENGVKPGEVVGVCLPRGLKLLVSLLGIIKAGAVYLPLDPDFPQDRLEYMIKDSDAKCILTADTTENLLKSESITNLDAAWKNIESCNLPLAFRAFKKNDLAYIIYTSGSTGRPKGVPITRQALDNFIISIQKRLQLTENDLFLAFSTISFDISLLELLLPLTVGAKNYIIDDEAKSNGFLLKQAVEKIKPSVMQATPSTWKMLLRTGWKGDKERLMMLCGGEALHPSLAEELLSRGRVLWNMYGPTEATIWSSCAAIKKVGQSITIGKPIDNIQYYILDEANADVKQGEVGELCIGGIALSNGYIHLPDKTQEKFTSLTSNPKQTIYKTGDLVRQLPDGDYEFVARKDNRVKIRGFLVEPEEIVHLLQEMPQISDAAVTLEQDDNGFDRLVAYYVNKNTYPTITIEAMKTHLEKKLPVYMVPNLFIELEAMPMTANLKVDVKRLPQFLAEKKNHVVQNSVGNEEILKIWQTILNVPITLETDFFHAGGSSLMLTELLVRMDETYPIAKFPIDQFIRKPTLSNMLVLMATGIKEDTPVASKNQIEQDMAIAFKLPSDINKSLDIADPRHILVTGASGFIGAHIIAELMQKTSAQIYAHVHAENRDTAKQKLIDQLKIYKLYSPSMMNRIEVIAGDIAKKDFGLNAFEFDLLSTSCDLVIHGAALINFAYSYDQLRDTNILGTKEVIEFCMRKRIKPLLFISTYSVFDRKASLSEMKEIYDDSPLPDINGLRNGYEQTKYMGEILTQKAMDAGLPALIVRPGRTFYNMKTNVINTNDLVFMVESMLKTIKIYPDNIEGSLNHCDVNNVAAVIAKLATNLNAYGKSYNIVEKNSIRWEELLEYSSKYFPDTRKVTAEEWLKNSKQFLINGLEKNASIYPLYLQETQEGFAIGDTQFKHANSTPASIRKELEAETPHNKLMDLLCEEVFQKLNFN